MAVSKQDLRAYEFESMDDYFEYILESEINGQRQQVYNLIKAMSKAQKKEAFTYMVEHVRMFDTIEAKDVKQIIFRSL